MPSSSLARSRVRKLRLRFLVTITSLLRILRVRFGTAKLSPRACNSPVGIPASAKGANWGSVGESRSARSTSEAYADIVTVDDARLVEKDALLGGREGACPGRGDGGWMVTGTTGEIGIADGGRGHGSDKMELGRGGGEFGRL